jgi:hypothetical protein
VGPTVISVVRDVRPSHVNGALHVNLDRNKTVAPVEVQAKELCISERYRGAVAPQ